MADLVELLFENCELLRHQCDAITQAYAASVGNRMNQVMKTLTILTSIFAPLTFIAGIYGMNFQHMPEPAWQHGYFYVLMVIASISTVQLGMFWWKDWLVLPNFMSRLTPSFLKDRKAQRRRR
jgi:magnesium transporter